MNTKEVIEEISKLSDFKRKRVLEQLKLMCQADKKNYPKKLDIPVIDDWYDEDQVTEIVDFLKSIEPLGGVYGREMTALADIVELVFIGHSFLDSPKFTKVVVKKVESHLKYLSDWCIGLGHNGYEFLYVNEWSSKRSM